MLKWLLTSVLITALLFFLLHILFPLPDKLEYSTIITGNKGEVLHAFLTKDEKWRMKTSLEEISPLLRTTIIEKEDKLFYYHKGVNPFAMARALAKNIFRGKRTSGASTITMQVARALEPKSRNYFNKLKEIFRACQLELKYNKDEILQMYCNLLPYGGNIEGVKSASLLYFNKDPDHLSLAEITALCVIPNRPSSLVPGKHNEAIIKERNRWLIKFRDEKVFTTQQIEDALSEPFDASRLSVPRYIPHLSYKLKKAGAPEIATTIDLHTQLRTEKIVKDYSRSLQNKNIRNAAVLIIDNSQHNIITYIGSADFNDTLDAGQVDGITAVRQPGSTLKPLLYGLCIDEGLLTPKAMIADVKTNYDGYAPENYDKKFNGYVTLEYALEHSLNIPAVKALNQLGKHHMIAALGGCRFRQIKKDQQKLGLSMILGGCGASLQELAGLYSAFANEGIYVEPGVTANGTLKGKYEVLSPAAAFMVNETLSKINRPDFPLNWQSTERMPKIAWKTGTSYGRRDAWSIGYNKKYTVAVWVGNFSALGIPELSGAEIATPLLFKIFNTIDYDSDQEWFSQPEDCDIRMVCSETGLLPAEHCQHTITDFFIPMVSSMNRCNNMQEVIVSADEKVSYCRACMPSSGYKKKLYKIIPPEMRAYYEENHLAYAKIPFHNRNCERVFKDEQPVILSPRNGTEYLISKSDPEPLQLQCRTAADVNQVFWYVNNQFFKTADSRSPQFFMPAEGRVKISCTDDKGRNRNIWINVKYVDL